MVGVQLRSAQEFIEYLFTRHTERVEKEKALADLVDSEGNVLLRAYCDVCKRETRFIVLNGDATNFRENLVCKKCRLNVRQRAMVSLASDLTNGFREEKAIFLAERMFGLYDAIKKRMKKGSLAGSEYFGDGYQPGQLVNGIEHQDLTRLSYPDASFDLIIANDIFEHICDTAAAFRECCRVLKPGGACLFTIPFHSLEERTVERAVIKEGRIEHLLEPQYHLDPVNSDGALVFHDFGWDILETIKGCGFADAWGLEHYDLTHGYIGNSHQLIFQAVKNGDGRSPQR